MAFDQTKRRLLLITFPRLTGTDRIDRRRLLHQLRAAKSIQQNDNNDQNCPQNRQQEMVIRLQNHIAADRSQ